MSNTEIRVVLIVMCLGMMGLSALVYNLWSAIERLRCRLLDLEKGEYLIWKSMKDMKNDARRNK